jgi:hypothetical protein
MKLEILRLHLRGALTYNQGHPDQGEENHTEDWIEVFRIEDLISLGDKGPSLKPDMGAGKRLFFGVKSDGEALAGGYRLEAGTYAFAQVRPAPTDPAEAILSFCRQCWWEGKLSLNSEFNLNSELNVNSELYLRRVREDGAWSLQLITKETA